MEKSIDILNNLGKFNDERSLQIDEESSYSY